MCHCYLIYMLPMRRNKEYCPASELKKLNQGGSRSKRKACVLKNYNSCLHQKIINKKDMPTGPTIYISSVSKKDLTKTLQAYHALALPVKRKNSNTDDCEENKSLKLQCEGVCGKFYHVSCFKPFSLENQQKSLCPRCIEQFLFGAN